MNLNIPTVGSTLGPAWANAINAALTAIDAHDHSSGKGAKVTTAGLNINGDLSFNLYRVTNASGILFSSVGTPPAGVSNYGSLYHYQNELRFLDGVGNDVQLTRNGGLGVFATLDANFFDITNIKSAYFISQAALAGSNRFGQVLNNLQFTDGNGITMKLTESGVVAKPVLQSVTTTPVTLTAQVTDHVVLVSTASAKAITLPAASAGKKLITIKDSTGNAAVNNIVINRAGADTIDGAVSKTINANYGFRTLVSDGVSGWFIIATG